MKIHPTTFRSTVALAMSAMLLGACAGSGDVPADTSAAAGPNTAAAPGMMAGDSMAGMDHSKMPGMDMPAAKDADQEFLRMMVDHHYGMTEMLDPAMEKATAAAAKADAKMLHDKQHAEGDRMVAMLEQDYGEKKEPMMMPGNKPMMDDLAATPKGAAYDRKMYQHVIMHHEEGVRMLDRFLPRLTKPAVRAMATKMRGEQAREIADFRKKSA